MRRLMIATLVLCACCAAAQTQPDPVLLAEIQKIKAIDNHTHVMKVVEPGQQDTEFDALPCDPLEPSGAPTMTRADNPAFLKAWKELYGYPYDDAAPQHLRVLTAAKEKVRRQQGENFPTWVLDRLGIETMLANRVAMGPGLTPPRFRWVPYDDALLFPLNNAAMADTPDRKIFFAREEALLKRYASDLQIKRLPVSLDEYVSRIVLPTLQRQKKAGAVAVKFEAAYLRALDFAPAPHDAAASIYFRQMGDARPSSLIPAPTKAEYKILQDYLFHVIAAEAGRLGMPVHLHTGAGCGGYFQIGGANPLLLEADLDDPVLRKTNFVLLHAGWPFTRETAFLMGKSNVWADTSEGWMISPHELANYMRSWMEWYPEKILFGTDLYAATPEIGWEEVGWQTSQGARWALAVALAGMIEDGEITRARALELAHMVLHDNAAKLYGIQ
ncbi:MAG: amidohydrolase [Acidobacteriia bacterium]|nr:amidohydrolase [Terriglobia bacterium]